MADGVFIKGQKMPTSCADCPCYNAEYLYCNQRNSIDIRLDARPSACELSYAADVRPVVRGKWIDEHPDKPNDPRMRCSVCTCVAAPLVKWRFCPDCGAMMEE